MTKNLLSAEDMEACRLDFAAHGFCTTKNGRRIPPEDWNKEGSINATSAILDEAATISEERWNSLATLKKSL